MRNNSSPSCTTVGLAVVLAAGLVPGCVLPTCGVQAVKDWNQPEVYDGFPPEGEKGGYAVGYHRVDGKITRKAAQNEEMTRSISVRTNGDIHWQRNAERALSNEATAEELRQMFRDLELPEPSLTDWEFRYLSGGC